MRQSYAKFREALDTIAPSHANNRRVFFGATFTSKDAIVEWVKKFPQLDDAVDNYRDMFDSIGDRKIWDMALVLWISALKHGDFDYADKIRVKANKQGVQLSRFPGNVFMRTQ